MGLPMSKVIYYVQKSAAAHPTGYDVHKNAMKQIWIFFKTCLYDITIYIDETKHNM